MAQEFEVGHEVSQEEAFNAEMDSRECQAKMERAEKREKSLDDHLTFEIYCDLRAEYYPGIEVSPEGDKLFYADYLDKNWNGKGISVIDHIAGLGLGDTRKKY